jgi:DNA-binding transcriptional LysR family regulator
MLDVRRLQALRAVIAGGSVTAAARNLGYTPSAVSQQVGSLERQTGMVLLERVGRGVQPTAAGRLLAEHAGIIAKHVADAEAALADLKAGRTGRLAICYFASAGAALMPPALAWLRRHHPDIQVSLNLIDPEDPLPAVQRREADLALVVGHRDDSRDGVRLEHLVDDPYRAVLPAGHPLAEREVLDLADLADEPWISNAWRGGPCVTPVLDACAAAGFTPRFAVDGEDFSTAQAFVAAGLGVSLIPQLGLTTVHPAVAVRPVRNPEPIRTISAAIRETSAAQPALQGFLDALRPHRQGLADQVGQPLPA